MTTSTSKTKPALEEMAALGEEIYQESIRPTLSEADIGKFVHIDVNSGEYEIDDDDIQGEIRLVERVPDARIHGIRIGYTAAYFFDGYYEEPKL